MTWDANGSPLTEDDARRELAKSLGACKAFPGCTPDEPVPEPPDPRRRTWSLIGPTVARWP